LTETVSLGWFGVLGALNCCELSLERQRMPDGVWVNVKQVLLIYARKMATAVRFRHTEESNGYRKTDPLQTSTPGTTNKAAGATLRPPPV